MMNKMNKNARKWGVGLLAAGLLLTGGVIPAETGHAAAASSAQSKPGSSVVLKFNGALTQQTGLYKEGKVWVPVSFLRDVLKLPVTYNKADNAYVVGKGTQKAQLMAYPGGVTISVNGFYIKEYEAKLLNGRMFVPFDLLSDYMGYQGDWNAASGRLNMTARPQNALKITTATIENNREGVTLKLDYPQISGLADTKVQNSINSQLKLTATNFEKSAKKEIAERNKEDRPYEYQASYVVTYNQNGVLSLITNQYGYMGGAHGMDTRQAFTFSLKDGKRLLLKDLFGANSNYKVELNTKLGNLIKNHDGYLGGFNGLATEKQFYLKDGKVTIFFQVYEYTAYAAGFPEYTFSFKELLPDGSSPFAALK
ncbi:hypothetical protein GCM10010912_61240 [Paenibacillus albidus]|uniref:DUF4163 domain-containing protein n=1 Tax=Paenibacillus albidus TaxID=2041023 RepID=A0A917D3J5_9BACL|nr:DUF4163 domain-containing protein [Paenibacillus albidus]GGG08389.1 hypothetical protein GCM10010912_61240 [Paenibacillus albidus]